MVDGKQIGEAILDVLYSQFGTAGEVISVDGKAICSTAKPGNPHSALQILSAYVTSSGIVLAQGAIHEKTNEIPVFQKRMSTCFLKIRAIDRIGRAAKRWKKCRTGRETNLPQNQGHFLAKRVQMAWITIRFLYYADCGDSWTLQPGNQLLHFQPGRLGQTVNGTCTRVLENRVYALDFGCYLF